MTIKAAHITKRFGDFTAVDHLRPMESLDNAFTDEELQSWYARLERENGRYVLTDRQQAPEVRTCREGPRRGPDVAVEGGQPGPGRGLAGRHRGGTGPPPPRPARRPTR